MATVLPGPLGITAPTELVNEAIASPDQLRKMSQAGDHPGVQITYWAKVEREMEEEEYRRYKAMTAEHTFTDHVKGYFSSDRYDDVKKMHDTSRALQVSEESAHWSEKDTSPDVKPIGPATHDLDAEWRQASRALRTASWGGVFYLITTDILGWGQTPYVFANDGYGLGAGIFVLMGLAAGCAGFMIWRVFIGLDSSRYPIMSYGDPFFRLYGPWMRHFINVAQAIQMFLTVAVVLLGQTGLIAQLAGSVNLCYVVCGIISLVVSMASGGMRTLKHLGWFCNAAVWINIVSFIIICVAAAKYGPDPAAAVQNGILNKAWASVDTMAPVRTFAGTPPPEYQQTNTDLFAAKFNGINSMVYAYSGAVMFIAFLSEMRHPMDFWKAVLLAQGFITAVYIFFGAFTYSYYGQYAYTTISQTVRPLGLQIVSNVLGLITGWLAVFLYFNVGMKVVYLEVGQQIFGLPPISTTKGKYLWWALGPFYWIVAFVVSMSVPQFNAFTNFVGGLFSLNFTYSFSGFMYLAYKIHQGAALPGEGFDPVTGVTTRHDEGPKRYIRGFLKLWYITIPVLSFTCAGLAASGMGTWAAVEGLKAAFGPGGSVLTSWTCVNPYYNP
ncbi:hypothetical protein N7468_003612 [Penicillium chermesinum]|uniref:Amino acid transporter transmembrane domain-containing protein n=1 Tax=Penicillium chermesinum TaxID=63820 RepID=A0A9W9P9D7_9EURO|nr:uncharacterized protein N7468_003612 [Penicillium chermesinum]KAJ5238993.1 hypothetical protein N7468_003612 [Penicillium chermesinum]